MKKIWYIQFFHYFLYSSFSFKFQIINLDFNLEHPEHFRLLKIYEKQRKYEV
jgi:hypothetical protein